MTNVKNLTNDQLREFIANANEELASRKTKIDFEDDRFKKVVDIIKNNFFHIHTNVYKEINIKVKFSGKISEEIMLSKLYESPLAVEIYDTDWNLLEIEVSSPSEDCSESIKDVIWDNCYNYFEELGLIHNEVETLKTLNDIIMSSEISSLLESLEEDYDINSQDIIDFAYNNIKYQ